MNRFSLPVVCIVLALSVGAAACADEPGFVSLRIDRFRRRPPG